MFDGMDCNIINTFVKVAHFHTAQLGRYVASLIMLWVKNNQFTFNSYNSKQIF